MASDVFNKKMGDYLERRRTPFCSTDHKNIFARFYCNVIVTSLHRIREFLHKMKLFFSPADVGDLDINGNEIKVVDAGISPAQRYWVELKKKIASLIHKSDDDAPREQPEDVDPELVAETIKKHKV
jgi:hypothetical protein